MATQLDVATFSNRAKKSSVSISKMLSINAKGEWYYIVRQQLTEVSLLSHFHQICTSAEVVI